MFWSERPSLDCLNERKAPNLTAAAAAVGPIQGWSGLTIETRIQDISSTRKSEKNYNALLEKDTPWKDSKKIMLNLPKYCYPSKPKIFRDRHK
jgi:hypothetical protein